MDPKSVIDITQELFDCNVYPGDPKPIKYITLSVDRGDVCNLTSFEMCAHNGTHVDAPYHFIQNGKTIDQMGLAPYIGDCYVARFEGELKIEDAASILRRAHEAGADKRILIGGHATVSAAAAKVFGTRCCHFACSFSHAVYDSFILSGLAVQCRNCIQKAYFSI